MLRSLKAGKNKINENNELIEHWKDELRSLRKDMKDTLDNRDWYRTDVKSLWTLRTVWTAIKEGVKAVIKVDIVVVGIVTYAVGNEMHLYGQRKSIENIPPAIEWYKTENRDLKRQINDVTDHIKDICPCVV